jgi:hypothetical protein
MVGLLRTAFVYAYFAKVFVSPVERGHGSSKRMLPSS